MSWSIFVICLSCETTIWADTGQRIKWFLLETKGSDVDIHVLADEELSLPTYTT